LLIILVTAKPAFVGNFLLFMKKSYFNKLKKLSLAIVIFCLFMSFMPAALALGIKISPLKIEEIVQPGETMPQVIKVTNSSEISKTLYPYFRDFVADGEVGSPKLIDIGSSEGMGAWIKLPDTGVSFAPNEEKEISFNIEVPKSVTPGGHYGAILFGNKPDNIKLNSEDKGAAMVTAQQVACLILLQVAGDVKEDGRIREFKTDKSLYSSPYKVSFLTRVENLGNVHIKPRGNIRITNMFGQEVANLAFNDQGSNTLPNSIRRYTNEWADKQGFGRFKASLGLTYGTPAEKGGNGMESMFAEQTFWIMPWRTIIPIFLGLVFLISLIILWLRFYKSKAVKKAMEQMGYGRVRYVKKISGPMPAFHFTLIISTILLLLFVLGMVVYFLFLA
jgi:hypothetical protein